MQILCHAVQVNIMFKSHSALLASPNALLKLIGTEQGTYTRVSLPLIPLR